MRLDGESIELNSWGGAICSFLLLIILSAYALQKFDILVEKSDQQLLEAHIFGALTDKDIFSYDNGLNFAIAFTGFDGETEPFNDPTIGEVVFNHYKWGIDANGNHFSGRFPIRSHQCSREELGIDGDLTKAKFHQILDGMKEDLHFYHKKFICIDKQDLVMYGDFSSSQA